MDVKLACKLQCKLGVKVDGNFGPISWTALFVHLGARRSWAERLAKAMIDQGEHFGVTTSAQRLAHFLAQIAHESANFRYMEEIASGAAYEGREDLGNVRPGDGKRFKGRGPIQITGRDNYRRYGALLGLDLEQDPEQASDPYVGMLLALAYWHTHNLNREADQDDLLTISVRINGRNRRTGLPNGWQDRQDKLRKMKELVS